MSFGEQRKKYNMGTQVAKHSDFERASNALAQKKKL